MREVVPGLNQESQDPETHVEDTRIRLLVYKMHLKEPDTGSDKARLLEG